METCHKRIMVTGGAGFLGQDVVRILRQRECKEIVIPRRSQYDLTQEAALQRLYRDARPEIVIHLLHGHEIDQRSEYEGVPDDGSPPGTGYSKGPPVLRVAVARTDSKPSAKPGNGWGIHGEE